MKRESFAYLEPYIPDMSLMPKEIHHLERVRAAEFMGEGKIANDAVVSLFSSGCGGHSPTKDGSDPSYQMIGDGPGMVKSV